MSCLCLAWYFLSIYCILSSLASSYCVLSLCLSSSHVLPLSRVSSSRRPFSHLVHIYLVLVALPCFCLVSPCDSASPPLSHPGALLCGQYTTSPMRPHQGDVIPKNILMIGPTGCGKTEIARRVAKMSQAPFIKVNIYRKSFAGRNKSGCLPCPGALCLLPCLHSMPRGNHRQERDPTPADFRTACSNAAFLSCSSTLLTAGILVLIGSCHPLFPFGSHHSSSCRLPCFAILRSCFFRFVSLALSCVWKRPQQ